MNWEISFMEFEVDGTRKFKVTRRLPELKVSETKIFKSEKKAQKQFEEWSK